MTTPTQADPRRITYSREDRDYAAYYDGTLIGFFATFHQAEIALDDYALGLIGDGLTDEVPPALHARPADVADVLYACSCETDLATPTALPVEQRTTECACCYSIQPCYDDGEAYICIERAACQARQATSLAPTASPASLPGEPHDHAATTAAPGPTCDADYRTLETLIRAVIAARANVTQPTPYDDALLSLARAVRREHVIGLSSDQAVANEYADDPAAFLADLDAMTPAQQARVSLRVARAWGVDISVVDQLWVETRQRLAA